MKLLRLGEVRISTGDVVFRESPWGRLTAALVCLALAAVPVWVATRVREFAWVWYAAGAVVLLFAAVMFQVFRRTLGPANWLVRLPATGGVVVKFRSYANAHLPEEDVVAFALSPGDVRFVRRAVVRRRRTSDGHERARFLDLGVRPEVAAEIGRHLAAEVRREEPSRAGVSVRTKHHHYPVTLVGDDVLRIEFRSSVTRVSPGVEEALRHIGRWATVGEPLNSVAADAPVRRGDSDAEARAKLRRLVADGRVVEATKAAREFYRVPTAEARQMVRELSAHPDASVAASRGRPPGDAG